MRKILPSTLLAASAVGALLVLPAGTANALSPACSAVNDVLSNVHALGPNKQLQQDVANQLLAIDASGAEKDAITNYANALTNGDAASIGTATTILNGVCNQG
ncbi:hypothetical protein [Nocardia aurantiaca]|uniref:Hemophore-related protein n=1 Tax=Nocardia aurantiaca TaxID=2675850 RepID=A0A6I3L8C4_9NOCA|nr:hypothetical protein [Nocardia aurantiaca]MTE16526.1 hypothetical protein [Nocardia aurantiaca]